MANSTEESFDKLRTNGPVRAEPVESMNGVRFSAPCETQGVILLSGPWAAGKFDVLSTWMPASCVPLKGVTASEQPACSASTG